MIVAMFPGQGSQHLNMGTSLFNRFTDMVNLASDMLGYSVEDLCCGINGFSENDINQTLYSQPAIFLVSCLEYLSYNKSDISICIGHSLGFISALFAADVISFSQGISIVRKRAQLMASAPKGCMAAVIGNDVISKVQAILSSNDFFDIEIANYNSDIQIVISGPEPSINSAKRLIEESNLKFIKLPVSGAFHSKLMHHARIEFSKFLVNFDFKQPQIDVISAMTGEKVSADFVLEELSFQLERPVMWKDTVLMIKELGVASEFIEFGPGEVLTKLNKYIV